MAQRRKSAKRTPRKTSARQRMGRRWSGEVARNSNALDLDQGVFTWKSPARIAASLKSSAVSSKRRKASPYRSALSMLTFHINRAGKNLTASQKKVLERAKAELRKSFGRD